MKTLAERLQFVMSEKGITQQKLADLIGITQQSVNKIVKGDTLNPKNIVEIANALGVDVQWLRSGDGIVPDFAKLSEKTTAYEEESNVISIPLLDIYASAGNGAYQSSDLVDVITEIHYNPQQFQRLFTGINHEHIQLINVKGDSMEPTLNSGDLLFVNIRIQHFDGDGVYVFNYDGTLFIKRLQKTGNKLTVISDNPTYEKWHITAEEEPFLTIYGKVLVGQSQKMKMFG
ncbi:XRE family transcriptional regulator [Ursidibacter sp. B-7004-1]